MHFITAGAFLFSIPNYSAGAKYLNKERRRQKRDSKLEQKQQNLKLKKRIMY